MSFNIFNTTHGLYGWGVNYYNQLGLGNISSIKVPTKLNFFEMYSVLDASSSRENNFDIISVSCGANHTIINTTEGLYVLGNNKYGQLGLGHNFKSVNLTKLNFFKELQPPTLKGQNFEILFISCGDEHTIVNTTDGLYVFGANYCGQLGLENTTFVNIPTKLDLFDDIEIIFISCGSFYTMIHTTDGLYVFGDNNNGQLGLGHNNDIYIPTKLKFNKNFDVISISCGGGHTIINTTDGLYVFGSNDCGQLGLGDDTDRNVPTKLDFLKCESKNFVIIDVSCGSEHTIVNTTDGVYVFGSCNEGQLGLGNGIYRYTPTKLDFFNEFHIISIYCRSDHTIVSTTDGLYVFGVNYDGELGLGDHFVRYKPTKLNFNFEIITKKEKRIKSAHSFV